MRSHVRHGTLLLAAALLCGCSNAPEATDAPPAAPRSGPLEQARRLIDQGDLDAALAALQGAPPGADAKYLEGRILAKKAETAPLPTPPPAPVPLPRGYTPPPRAAFKNEEIQALERFEEALAVAPNHAGAHLAIADLLAPHALRRLERSAAPTPRAHGRRGKTPTPAPPVTTEGPDVSPERVIREYRAAAEADSANTVAVEALIDFCDKAQRPVEGEAALEELLRRVRERPEPFVRYGDFLRARRDWDGAIAQYRQALIWKSDDLVTQAKIGDIYIGLGEEHFARREYGAAEQRYKDAQKWVKDRNTPTGQRLQAALGQLAQIRRGGGAR